MSNARITVMTDTNSGIFRDRGRADGIEVIPMPVIIDDKDYLEGENLTQEALFKALSEEREVHSSQPSVGELTSAWDKCLQSCDEIVYVPMSSGLSGACETAAQFAKEYGGRVQVVDNHRISVSLMESVYDAVALAKKGLTAAQIKARLEENAFQSSIYITVNTLNNLKKSGRVTPAAAMLATVLNLKPILTIQGERLDAYAKARGMKHAEEKMIEAAKKDLETRFANVPKERLHLATAGTLETAAEAKAWRMQVQEAFPEFEVYYEPLSCSIASHVGVGTQGIGIIVTDRE